VRFPAAGVTGTLETANISPAIQMFAPAELLAQS
jgi:hypothetical protein